MFEEYEKKLKPCAYCGNEHPTIQQAPNGMYGVVCTRYACRLSYSMFCESIESAVEVWNNNNGPTVKPTTTEVVISDDFGNELKGLYDKGRDMIFTSYGNAPRKWFGKKYKITEANNE